MIAGEHVLKVNWKHSTQAEPQGYILFCVPTSPAQSTLLKPMQHDGFLYGSTRESSFNHFLEQRVEDPRLHDSSERQSEYDSIYSDLS